MSDKCFIGPPVHRVIADTPNLREKLAREQLRELKIIRRRISAREAEMLYGLSPLGGVLYLAEGYAPGTREFIIG